MKNSITFIAVAMMVPGFFFGAFLCGVSLEHKFMKDRAVEHGAAEYYLDENHERQFRWLDERP